MSRNNPTDTRTRILEATWRLMEDEPGKLINMSQVAKASELSRQAVYLHFKSRTELFIAVTHHVDEVKGLNQRLASLQSASSGEQMLERCVEVWGAYIPEIYGVAKSLMMAKPTDEAAATAWRDVMGCLYEICAEIIQALKNEKQLAANWRPKEATDLLWNQLSIENWEQLTQECNWSNARFITLTKQLLKNALLKP